MKEMTYDKMPFTCSDFNVESVSGSLRSCVGEGRNSEPEGIEETGEVTSNPDNEAE